MNICLKSPLDNVIIEQLTENQLKFLEDRKHQEIVAENPDWLNLVRKGEEDSIPDPAKFEFDADGFDGDVKFYVLLSENDDMSNAKETLCERNSCEIYNLFLGKQYFWKVAAKLGEKQIDDSINEKCKNFLRACGITDDDMAKIRDIMTEPCN